MNERAPVVHELKYDGSGTRPRCTACRKIAKHSQVHALEAATKIEASRGVAMVVYFNKRCGWWHLARPRHQRRAQGPAWRLKETVPKS